MSDFTTARKKTLDLVIARPADHGAHLGRTFSDIAEQYDVQLTSDEEVLLAGLPLLREGRVGSVVALEAKAAMTAHTKAKPRLYDELNSSHATVHGAADQAIAAAGVVVNAGPEFLRSDLNRNFLPFGFPNLFEISATSQLAPAGIIAKLEELPRRWGPGSFGFDAVGITVT